jgi:hypothetical protein
MKNQFKNFQVVNYSYNIIQSESFFIFYLFINESRKNFFNF